MRVVSLSDYPGDLLKNAQRRELKQHEATVSRHRAEVSRLERERDRARAARRWFAWLRAALAVRSARRTAQFAAGVAGAAAAASRSGGSPSDEQRRLTAGIQGEQLVADQLERTFGKDWVLFRGYRNKAGEIDQILLGPRGLVAIEVKAISGTVGCDGDRWWVDRLDHRGREDLLDKGKRPRSPSMQLNEPTDLLEEFLRSRGQDIALLRVVYLAHERSQVGSCRRATVSIFTSVSQVADLIRKMPQPLDTSKRTTLEDLIIRDHKHHDAQRQQPRRRA